MIHSIYQISLIRFYYDQYNHISLIDWTDKSTIHSNNYQSILSDRLFDWIIIYPVDLNTQIQIGNSLFHISIFVLD